MRISQRHATHRPLSKLTASELAALKDLPAEIFRADLQRSLDTLGKLAAYEQGDRELEEQLRQHRAQTGQAPNESKLAQGRPGLVSGTAGPRRVAHLPAGRLARARPGDNRTEKQS